MTTLPGRARCGRGRVDARDARPAVAAVGGDAGLGPVRRWPARPARGGPSTRASRSGARRWRGGRQLARSGSSVMAGGERRGARRWCRPSRTRRPRGRRPRPHACDAARDAADALGIADGGPAELQHVHGGGHRAILPSDPSPTARSESLATVTDAARRPGTMSPNDATIRAVLEAAQRAPSAHQRAAVAAGASRRTGRSACGTRRPTSCAPTRTTAMPSSRLGGYFEDAPPGGARPRAGRHDRRRRLHHHAAGIDLGVVELSTLGAEPDPLATVADRRRCGPPSLRPASRCRPACAGRSRTSGTCSLSRPRWSTS
jgi:hypothetical protein